MSDALIGLFGSIFSAIVTIIVVLIQGSNTKDSLMNEIKNNQAVMNTDMNNLKAEMKELKDDVKKHNSYGLQIENLRTRVEALEKK